MTRIALIAGTYQPNHCGVAHYTSHLRGELHDRGIYTTVLTTHQVAQQAQASDVIGVVEGWTMQDLLPLVRAIHQVNVDLLHIQHAAGTYGFNRAIFLLPLLLKLTGWRKPIVTTIHEYGWWEWQPKWISASVLERMKTWGQSRYWWDREDGFLLTLSDAIITTNQNATQVIQARLPKLASKVSEVPIGANIEVGEYDRAQAQIAILQQTGWTDDTMIIVFFGFLHPVKGLETLLPAFQQVLAHHPKARLLLVGGVESLALQKEDASRYWQKLQETIAALDLQNAVYMTGYVEDAIASQYLTGADIGVLTFNHGVSLKSGSLLALMGHSLPVVATRSTPPDPDLNDSPVQLVTPRDVDELTMELNRLVKDAELRQQLGTAGQLYSKSFSWGAIAAKHLEIYQRVRERRIEMN